MDKSRGVAVAKRHFLRTVAEAKAEGRLTQDLERDAEMIRCAFDECKLAKHKQQYADSKKNLDTRLADFGVKFAAQNS